MCGNVYGKQKQKYTQCRSGYECADADTKTWKTFFIFFVISVVVVTVHNPLLD